MPEATTDYRHREDMVSRWMTDEGLDFGDHLSSQAVSLQESWQDWNQAEHGRRRTFKDVTARLEAAGCRKTTQRTRSAGRQKQSTTWRGIGWETPKPTDKWADTEVF